MGGFSAAAGENPSQWHPSVWLSKGLVAPPLSFKGLMQIRTCPSAKPWPLLDTWQFSFFHFQFQFRLMVFSIFAIWVWSDGVFCFTWAVQGTFFSLALVLRFLCRILTTKLCNYSTIILLVQSITHSKTHAQVRACTHARMHAHTHGHTHGLCRPIEPEPALCVQPTAPPPTGSLPTSGGGGQGAGPPCGPDKLLDRAQAAATLAGHYRLLRAARPAQARRRPAPGDGKLACGREGWGSPAAMPSGFCKTSCRGSPPRGRGATGENVQRPPYPHQSEDSFSQV